MAAFITYYRSPIGTIRIAGNEHFISEMNFIDSNDQWIQETPVLPSLAIESIEQLIQYFQGMRRIFELSIQQEGTAFQKKVWHELLNIPYGKKLSYLDLARKLGDPNCIRAAAAANGRNRIAIIVPCHRVVGSRNDLVGYAGGLWRKKWLLELENKVAYGVQTLF